MTSVSLYLVPFLRYSASDNGVSLNVGYGSFKVIENGAVRKFVYGFLFAFHEIRLYLVSFPT